MKKLIQLAQWLKASGIHLYYVGGCVRDEIMGLPVEDVDICVVGGGSAENVQGYLDLMIGTIFDNVTSVHGDFPIWVCEIDGEKYEFAMARTERKNGQSHQDFLTEVRNVTIEEDLKRRDFTINSIAKNVLTGELIDPYDGIKHIEEKLLVHTSSAFMEDPLRVFRAARFIARFGFEPHGSLSDICAAMGEMKGMKEGISNERVGLELMKTLKTAKKPSYFFYFLSNTGWLNPWFEELEPLIGLPQSATHHPEGDVFIHTMHCLDAVPKGDWFMRAVMLCHDLGKATTTTIDGLNWIEWQESTHCAPSTEKIQAIGHEAEGVELTRKMLQRIHFCDHATIRKIACLVELHMIRAIINDRNYDKVVRRTLRRLMHYDLTYTDLVRAVMYDLNGRPPRPWRTIHEVEAELHCDHAYTLIELGDMEPIVTGKALLQLGCEPSPEMGTIIKHALELQDRGTLKRDNWLKVLKGAHPHYFKSLTV